MLVLLTVRMRHVGSDGPLSNTYINSWQSFICPTLKAQRLATWDQGHQGIRVRNTLLCCATHHMHRCKTICTWARFVALAPQTEEAPLPSLFCTLGVNIHDGMLTRCKVRWIKCNVLFRALYHLRYGLLCKCLPINECCSTLGSYGRLP